MTTWSSKMRVAVVALVVVGFGVSSATAEIIDPDTITGTDVWDTWWYRRPADLDILTDGDKQGTGFGSQYGSMYLQADLGSTKEVDGLYFSYYADLPATYHKPQYLWFWINDTGDFTGAPDGVWDSGADATWPNDPPGLPYFEDLLAPLGGTGRYVQVALTAGGSGNWQYVSEIQFNEVGGADQIPEPATMALLGLGGLCVLRRRRRA